MTLAALLAAMLLAGIVLSLRVASRAVRLSEMKSDFVSNVSHELRTPVASIRVFGELLRHGRADSPEKVRRYGEHIETESRRLTRLIDNVLDFSRMESGRKEYHFERARLEHVVESAVDATRVRLREAGFDVRYEAPESELPALELDPDAIGQVLHNLIDNAVKYSGEARRIDLRVYRENATAVVSVRDEGVGIPRDEQQRIFERFHRVQTSLVHDVQGSGLGLAIVQHVVRAHGGRVDVESERGRGTTVFVRIPLSNGGSESSGRTGDES
jgi:signal transduction histidine kinase